MLSVLKSVMRFNGDVRKLLGIGGNWAKYFRRDVIWTWYQCHSIKVQLGKKRGGKEHLQMCDAPMVSLPAVFSKKDISHAYNFGAADDALFGNHLNQDVQKSSPGIWT